MTRISRLLCSVAVVPLGFPAAAVTPEEVWTLLTEVTEATGAAMTATTNRSGDVLTASDVAIVYTFPFGAGDLSFRIGDVILTEQPDGTVAMGYPGDAVDVAFAGSLTIEGDTATATGTLAAAMPGMTSIASGTADDITIVNTIPSQSVTVTNLDLTIPDDEIDLSGALLSSSSTDGAATVRYVREADVYRVTSSGTQGASEFTLSIPAGEGLLSEQTGGNSGTASEIEFVLPKAPMSILNLSAAVRNGLSMKVETRTSEAATRSVSRMGDTLISDQSQMTQDQNVAVSFGPEGLVMEATATDADVTFMIPDVLPFPASLSIASGSALAALPVLASPDMPFTMEYDVVMEGLSIADDLWSLFDPGAVLPRDPMDLTIDLGADIRPAIDALDIVGLISTAQSMTPDAGLSPFLEIDELRIDALKLNAVGVSAEGEGAFTLDFSDMVTFPGMPRPEGTANMTLSGANALIDALLELGLLTDQDAMPARMGLGMFTTPVGDDAVESALEVNSEGHVILNGQRMR